ncbi:hypothetical protein PSHT_07517 [Puccinia striiformis]|uniref:Reverse transcriptase n=1 Tax=Puccinia striiformis TaxID=27350 RepID=A0A2S4VX41_9BASI|nr:hypothetical protein PSHT_07517 [Puccinia striiformis]
MNVDQANVPAAKPSPAPTPFTAPTTDYPPLVRCYEDDVGKILKGWPTKNLPEFSGDPSSNAEDWLGRMKTWLSDVQAHPGVWHSVAGRRLTGTAWNHWQDASANNTRPDNWDGFRAWLLAHSPLGPTTHSVHTALQKLNQRSDESAKDFITRFQAWQASARSLDFRYEEEVEFMAKLRSGLSHKVTEAYHTAERDGKKLNLLQLFTTALNCDQAYHSRPAASGSSSRGRGGNPSGKRRAEGDANEAAGKLAPVLCYNCRSTTHRMKDCPIPKTNRQLAYEAATPFQKMLSRRGTVSPVDRCFISFFFNAPRSVDLPGMGTTRSDELLLSAADVVQDCLSFEPIASVNTTDEPASVCVQFHHTIEGRLARVLLDTGTGSSVAGAFGDSFGMTVLQKSGSPSLVYLSASFVVEFQPGLSDAFDAQQTTLAPLTDADELSIPAMFRRRGIWPGAVDKLLALTESEGVAGPCEELPATLPSSFGTDVSLTSTLRKLISEFSTLFDPISKASTRKRVIEHLVDTGAAQPVYQPVRQLSPALLGTLKERLAGLQEAGFIRPSTSAWSSPIVFVKNPTSGKVRLLSPDENRCTDVPKTAFGTKYGHYEWLVMPFGLVNAPSTFQRMMTHILRDFIDVFVQVYLDDILVYSPSEADHIIHVRQVLQVLRDEELKCSGAKCSFGLREIQYVGHVVGHNTIRPMAEKIESIQLWPQPSTVFDVRSFLGLSGFYRRYVRDFAKIAAPLHDLTAGGVRKRERVTWQPVHDAAFRLLKEALVSTPVLLTPDTLKEFVMETDASDFAVGAVLLQNGDDDRLHPVAFESRKLNSAQINYLAQERELLAIIHAWRKWHVYLDGAVETTVVYTDHASLVYLKTQKLPSKRLCRWLEEFAEMDIDIRYKKGSENTVPDALSRRSDLLLMDEIGDTLHDTDWPLLIPYILDKLPIPSHVSPGLEARAKDNLKYFDYDPEAETLIYLGRPGLAERSPFIPLAHRFDLLRVVHDGLDVDNYVKTCASCQIHERSHPFQETSKQIPLPAVGPFERWSSDFITMPESHKSGYKWILTAIDHCTSWPVVVPMKVASAAAIAQAVFDHIVMPFGRPREFLTDRGSNFLSAGLLNSWQLPDQESQYLWIPPSHQRVHASDSSKFSPFELVYGVKPRLLSDKNRMIAADPVCPGEAELASRIAELNKLRLAATGNLAVRAEANRKAFDNKTTFSRDLNSLVVGQSVKLRNEEHTKGAPRWFGPFEISKVLDKNAYILVDQDGVEYSRPVNGNSLRPVSLRSLIVNGMWAPPPAIAQRERQAEARVAKALVKQAAARAPVAPALPIPMIPVAPPVPAPNRPTDDTPGITIELHEPIAPSNGACYSVAEIKAFSENERAWYEANRHLPICQEDYIGTDDSMNVDQANVPAAKPSPAPTPFTAPTTDYPPLVRCYEDDVGKILKGWPTKNLPEFSGDPSSNAEDWLGRMKTWLSDVQAHPGVWHSVAGRRLTGTAWNHWQDASANNTRPDNWDGFRAWLLAHSPLGPTTHSVHTALQKLNQRSDESAKDFITRFQAWQASARSLDFRYEEEVEFMAKLRSGLSHKVTEAYHTAERDGKKLNLLQLFTTALNCDQAYHSRPAASGSSSRGRGGNPSGKRRAEGDANEAAGKLAPVLCYNCRSTTHRMKDCPIPKTNRQLANLPMESAVMIYEPLGMPPFPVKSAPRSVDLPGMGTTRSDELLLSAADVVQDCLSFEPIASVNTTDEPALVCVQFHHTIEGRLARVLLDTGTGSSVAGAFGDLIWDDRLAEVRFSLSGLSFRVLCRLAPLSSYDIILGRDWIAAHVASTDWERNTWRLKNLLGDVVEFQPGLSDAFDAQQTTLAPLTDADELSIPAMFRRRGIWPGAVDKLLALTESEGVAGPCEELPATLPSSFGTDVSLTSTLRKLISEFSTLFDPISKASTRKRVIEHLVDTGAAQPVYQPVRQLSPALLGTLKERLAGLQEAGFIRPSTSAWSSPIVFVKNPTSGKVRLCVDYRQVNALTKKDRHPLPVIQECFDALRGARFFSKIDLQQGFHQMRIAATDVPKTAFGTKYGHYEWLVMPFGLVNAPSTFQRMMTHILRDFIDVFVQVYLDDILVYSPSEADHIIHVRQVLQVLRDEELKCSGAKCSFGLREIQYVGHVVGHNTIRPMAEKIESIQLWPQPSTVFDVRSFLGLSGFYRRYVRDFAKIAAPLHDLTAGGVRKRERVTWQPVHDAAFRLLKEALVSTPVLLTPDTLKEFVMETDASDFAVGAVLLQNGDDDRLHPVAFESRKLNSAQINYLAQERELLAIIHAWRKWHVYLDGAVETTVVYTDHASLVYLKTQKLPSKRLCRWLEEFAEMDIDIRYKKGSENTVPDALSRRSDLLLMDEIGDTLHDTDWPLLIPYILDKLPIPSHVSPGLEARAKDNLKYFDYDPEAETLIYLGRPGLAERSPFIPLAHRFDLLRVVHDGLGHRGRDGTLQALRTRGWWPKRYEDVDNYVKTCASCQIHERSHPFQETSKQIPLPAVGPFERWSSDFITMPESHKSGYKWILTAIDHCTSWPVVVPMKVASAAAIAQAVFDHIVMPFGRPREFLTDRGSNFLSAGFAKFLAAAGIKKVNTSGYHPRTNGKCERYNGILENALFRLNTSGDPKRWEDYLPAAVFSTRVHASDSSKFSPFELVYGVKPRLLSDKNRMIAADPVCPGEAELASRIAELNKLRLAATGNLAVRAEANRKAFDNKTTFSRDLNPGCWAVLDKNAYILVDQDGVEYSRPVNGNSLRPVSLRSLIVNGMWAPPPAIAQRERQAEARVAKALVKQAAAVAKLSDPASTRSRKSRVPVPPASPTPPILPASVPPVQRAPVAPALPIPMIPVAPPVPAPVRKRKPRKVAPRVPVVPVIPPVPPPPGRRLRVRFNGRVLPEVAGTAPS